MGTGHRSCSLHVKESFPAVEVDIRVETLQGMGQLSGFVGSDAQKQQAEAIARSVNGVRGVDDNIIVKAS